MNREKARDFFSSYAEGTLEPGLRHSFEQQLRQDAEMKAEFESFQSTLGDLDGLRFVSAPVPDDLHDKIAARLDLQVWEQKRASGSGWAGWLRNIALGGVGAAALLGAVLSIMSHGSGSSNASGLGSLGSNQLQATPVDKTVRVSYIASAPRSISVESGDQTLRVDHLSGGQKWETTLTNSQPKAAIFKVAVSDEAQQIEVSIPGSTATHPSAGRGTIESLAKALSDTYRVPVILSGHDLTELVPWDFKGEEVSEAAGQALQARGFTVEVKNGNAIWITQNN